MRLAVLVLAIAGIALVLVGCGSKRFEPEGSIRLAVLDGIMEEGAHETRRSQTGYWMSRRDRFDSGNAGVLLGEVLAREFEAMPGVRVHSRTDLAAFMAQRERLLRRAFPDLTPEDRLEVLSELDPTDYGRALNVDYVLRGRVRQSRLIHNRFFHGWYSRAEVVLEIWNVETGEQVWEMHRADAAWFRSQLGALDKIARKARRQAEREDVFRLQPASTS